MRQHEFHSGLEMNTVDPPIIGNIHRDRLHTTCWGDADKSAEYANLYNTLYFK
jgi:hypothetical protein